MRVILASLLAAVVVSAAAQAAINFNVVNNGAVSYQIDSVDNPTLTVHRGSTYTFTGTATGHPFWIMTAQVTGTGSAYNTGVTNNGIQSGTVTWVVDPSAPNTLFYNCQIHSNMTGAINVTDAVPAVTPLTAGVLVVLLAGAGIVFARRRAANGRAV